MGKSIHGLPSVRPDIVHVVGSRFSEGEHTFIAKATEKKRKEESLVAKWQNGGTDSREKADAEGKKKF